jgi:hypothetical protein
MRCCQKLVIPCRITKSQMLIHEHASVTAVRFLQYQSSNNNPSCTPASFTATIQTVLQYTDLQTCCCFSTGGDNCSDAQIFVLAVCSCQSINLTSCDVHMVITLNLSISKSCISKVADITSVSMILSRHLALQIKGTDNN